MPTPLVKYLTSEEVQAINKMCISQGFYAYDQRVFLPGTVWEANWLWDPREDNDVKHPRSYLSNNYYRDWARIRPPLVVVCPNHRQWCIDAIPSDKKDGSGWIVTGQRLELTTSPSIVVPGYHGWLRNGVFTDDIEGRGPNGIYQPYVNEKK